VRLIVARCEVRYSGRLNALLPEALRLLGSNAPVVV
jgi:RecB family endonuclease NucS